MANASSIIYTGLRLSHINTDPNTALDVILALIDDAIGSGSGNSPDYSGYNLYCVKQTDGTTHPTNTQNFAEGISKALCDLKTAYNTFVGTTYAGDSSVFTTAINNLTDPGYVYVPFSIVDTDTITQVWGKAFTGFTGIINSIKPDSANWSTIGASTATSIVSAFNTLIAYEVTQDTTIGGKQASLGTFNTTSIGGSTGQSPVATINALLSYAAGLPTYATGSVTWGCVTQGGTLTTDINSIVTKLNYLTANYIADSGTGLTKTNIGSCQGYRIAIDDSWVGLYKVAVDEDDATNGTGDYLINKLISSDSSVEFNVVDNQIDVTSPLTEYIGQVRAKERSNPGYLSDILGAGGGDWGMSIDISFGKNDNALQLTPKIVNPDLFLINFMTSITQAEDDVKAQFCALIASCASCSCTGPTSFSVTTNS